MAEDIGHGIKKFGRIGLLVGLAVVLVAALFTIPQSAQAAPTVAVDDVAVVTLSAPKSCDEPFWFYMNSSTGGVTRGVVEHPHARTTDGYMFEQGHNYFGLKCANGSFTRFDVTGPTNNLEDRIEEMRWTHRASKCRDCEVIMYHPDYVAVGLPDAGYRTPVSWDQWLAEAERLEIDEAVNLTLLTEFVKRDVIGAAALIIDGDDVRVQISHINH